MRASELAAIAACALLVAGSAAAQTSGKSARRPRAPQAAPAAVSSIYEAEEAIARKDYAKAEQLLRALVAQTPGDHRAWFDLGFVLNASGRKPEAIEAYRRAVELKPEAFESNLNLGILLGAQDSAEAEGFLRAATRLKPTKDPEEGLARAWLSLGRVLEATKPTEAVEAFAQAAKLRPGDAEAHIAAGEALEKSGDRAAAEREFKQAAALDAQSSEALAGLVNVYSATKRFPEAEAALRQYLSVQPGNTRARIQLARVVAAQGRAAEGIRELEGALGCNGAACGDSTADEAAVRELAGLYGVLGQHGQAEGLYRALVARSPAEAELRYALGTVLMNQRRFAEAQPELLKAVELKPAMAGAYGNLAVAAAENKNYTLAIRAVDARARYLPETPATYFLRATAYDNLHDFKQAAVNYRQFLAVSAGRNPDQEWQARHRLTAIEPKH